MRFYTECTGHSVEEITVARKWFVGRPVSLALWLKEGSGWRDGRDLISQVAGMRTIRG